MKNIVFFITILLQMSCVNAQDESVDIRFQEIDKKVEKLMADFHAAGLAVAVIEKDKTIYSKGFGYRDFENKIPVDKNTLFGIGSCTKAFTVSLIGKLVDDGKLKLEDSPSQYIPELKFFNKRMDDELKIKHMLSHSSGLSNMSTESSMILFPPKKNEDLIPRLKYLEPTAEVGESFMYSNYMVTMAAVLTERISGKDWRGNLSDLIFEPLEMNQTTVGFKQATRNSNLALGYAVHDAKIKKVMPDTIIGRGPAGDVFSTTSDLSKWVTTWLNNGKYKATSILSSDFTKAAMTGQQALPPPENSDAPTMFAGYGWFIEKYHGYQKVHHSGGISGYTANIAMFPSEEIGIIVLTNQSNSNLAFHVTELLEDALLDIQRTEEQPINYGPAIVIEPLPEKMTINQEEKPTQTLADFSGTYSRKGFGTFTVEMKDNHLFVKFPFTTFRFVHRSGNVFESVITEEIPTIMQSSFLVFSFQENEKRNIESVSVNMESGGAIFKKN